jgi:hypothetical protein
MTTRSADSHETLLEAIAASLNLAIQTPDGVAPPAALLLMDKDCQWLPLLEPIMMAIPQFYALGTFSPERRQGPVIWLKCIVERSLPDMAPEEGVVPIVYLPRVGRQDLRAAGDCDPMLQPLIELQYRGGVWHQRNGRDWTVEAFLTSDDALALDIALDDRTRDAMMRALPLLAQEPIAGLRGRRLEADDFDRLTIGDPVRDLLTWLSDAEAFEDRCDAGRWATFRDVCVREFSVDPDTDGPRAAADALTEGGGKWDEVWQRFYDAPKLYPGVSTALRAARPKDLLGLIDQSRRPGLNEEQEDKLRKELEAVAELPHADACDKIAKLDEEHKERREWVWTHIGESPFALALDPLGRLARAAKRTLGGASAETLISDYIAEGWRCDLAAIEALSSRKPGAEHDLITKVVRALYEPWLDRSARRFQEMLSADDADPGKLASGVVADPDTCVLFTDGLRFDLGMMLQERLESRGVRTRMSHRIAAIPTVTATAKPLASPAYSACAGGSDAEDFYPLVSDNGKPANAQRLRDAMVRQGVEILEDGETRLAVGSETGAWTEMGKIDSLGHSLDAALVRQIDPEIESIVDRIDALLNAGWSKVRVVTDHGWLLLPGGLPKVELPPYLVETKWARCAAVKGSSTPSVPTYPWYWNPLLRIASPPGIGAFRVNVEYTHGGVSLQECVVPDMVVERGEAAVSASITDISWRGMRCRIRVDTNALGLTTDLRLNWKQAESSIVAASKGLTETGEASLAVSDDSHEGVAASVVVIDQTGRVLDHKPTTVGEET